nr:SprT family zinc-dependent metalloprotease [Tissierella sp.]
MVKVKIKDRIIDCNINYGSGKKISINIDGVGFISVKAPKGIDQEELIKSIAAHGKWIRDRLDAIEELKERGKPREYDQEGKFLHLGKEFYLQELINVDGLSEEELKIDLKKFYFASVKEIIEDRIKIYQKELGVKAKGFEIEESTKRWGSCSSKKYLTFNYRLAMAPIEVIDYIIVHELCHLSHMNHDRSFWRLVGSLVRDYKRSEEYLMRYGRFMEF